jgi:zinc transport system substrate-binding protein
MKRLVVLPVALAISCAAWADPPRVVASTGWVAAFVRTAGFTGPVRVLAPFELQHPPEYELKPSDVPAVAEADVLVYAGYERMVGRLLDATKNTRVKSVRIATEHSLKTMTESVLAVAAVLGTTEKAEENLRAVARYLDSWRQELAARGLAGASVIAHVMHRPLLEELGFRVAGVYGPGPLEAARIRDLSALGVSLVADNVHNPVGTPLEETVRSVRYLLLRNFPSGDVSLLEILAEDRRLMSAAWGAATR